uniref:PIF-2 n=1 Tax=Faxonius propinquus nudivirus TaxID=3139431 RepID=A0AAU8GEY1_9VIRU
MMHTRSKIGSLYLIIISITIIFILIYYFASLNIDTSAYFKYLKETNIDFLNKSLIELKNANALVNLPNINIITNNSEVDNIQQCKDGPIFLGETNSNKNYENICKNSCGYNASVVYITNEVEYYSNDQKLTEGVWCILNNIECNPKTGYVISTINSKLCKSKYPRMFGGEAAMDIIACNNELYPATGSVLWDTANNEAVNPLTIIMTHEDETIVDGTYRFVCKFSESDRGNPYIPHPKDRFHPIIDPCNKTITRASYNVHTTISENNWFCECGDFNETRVKHLDESNVKSTCTSCYKEIIADKLKLPYLCFNQFSNYKNALNILPCLNYKDNGNECDSVYLNVTKLSDTTNPIHLGGNDRPYSGILLTVSNKNTVNEKDVSI